MKCSESPIISTVRNANASDGPAREAAAQFAAELTRTVFAPLAKSLGFFGDATLASVSLSIARRESGGLTDEIERMLERAR